MSFRRLLGPSPAAPGALARLAAYVSAGGWLVYAAEKVYMSAIGKIGMPGHIAPASVQERYDHATLAQAANATLGVLAAVVALATVHRWAHRIPGLPMLAVLAGASVPMVAGIVLTFTRPPGMRLETGPENVLTGLQLLAWLLVVTTYTWRTLQARSAVSSVRREAVT